MANRTLKLTHHAVDQLGRRVAEGSHFEAVRSPHDVGYVLRELSHSYNTGSISHYTGNQGCQVFRPDNDLGGGFVLVKARGGMTAKTFETESMLSSKECGGVDEDVAVTWRHGSGRYDILPRIPDTQLHARHVA